MGIGVGAGLAIAGGVAAAGTLGSSLIQSSASKSAASTQAAAANQAAQIQYQMYQQTVQRLQPWVDTGQAANQQLGGLLGLPGMTTSIPGLSTGMLVQPFQPTMDQLAKTPGYQFTLNQGLQGVQNSAAAMGLGQSGAALKGAANYAEGLASTTYQQQFNNYWQQLGNIANMLGGVSQAGGSAAALQGQAGLTAGTNAGNFLTAGANAQAAGTIGSAAALSGGLQSASSLPFQIGLANQLGLFGGMNSPNFTDPGSSGVSRNVTNVLEGLQQEI